MGDRDVKRAGTPAGLRRLCGLVLLLLCAARLWNGCDGIQWALEASGFEVIRRAESGCPPGAACIVTRRRRELEALVDPREEGRLRVALRRSLLVDVLGRFARRSRLEENEAEETVKILYRLGVAEEHSCEKLFTDDLCERISAHGARVYVFEANVEELMRLAKACQCCLDLLERLFAE